MTPATSFAGAPTRARSEPTLVPAVQNQQVKDLVTKVAPADGQVGQAFSVSATGEAAALISAGPTQFPDVFVATGATTRKLTNLAAQTAAWAQPSREVISWKSQDGATIEGGIGIASFTAKMNSRSRLCATNSAASITSAP